MEAWLYALISLSILGGISLFLMALKFHYGFIITFFFQGSLYISVTVWESPLWNPGDGIDCVGGWDWLWGLWGLMFMFLIPLAFLSMFIYAQSREEKYKIFGKYYSIEASIFLMLLVGNWFTFGVVEDFGCYIIWGLENFHTYAAIIHGDAFLWGIPSLYWYIISGLILQVLAFSLSRMLKMRRIKSLKT